MSLVVGVILTVFTIILQSSPESAGQNNSSSIITKTTNSHETTTITPLPGLQTADPLESEFLDRLKDLLLVLHKFHTLTFSTLESGKELFEAVIVDIADDVKHEQTNELKAKKEKLSQFIQKVDRFFPNEDFYYRPHLEILEEFKLLLNELTATEYRLEKSKTATTEFSKIHSKSMG